MEELRVVAVVLPHPRALLGHGRQRGGVGVVPQQGAALLVGGLAGDLAHAGEVAEVLACARRRSWLRALLPLPVDLHAR